MKEKLCEFKVFRNEKLGELRTTMIDGEPWFVGRDVAECLGYKAPHKPARYLVDERNRNYVRCFSCGAVRRMTIINEAGLRGLICASQMPAAWDFMVWVTADVLPAMRQGGGEKAHTPEEAHDPEEAHSPEEVHTPEETCAIARLLGDLDFLIAALQALKAERETAACLREETAAQEKQPEELRQDEQAQKPADGEEEESCFGVLVVVLEEG